MEGSIDLNADVGESFGAYRMGEDEKLLDFITSANIACGYHAGDPSVMRATVRQCVAKGVAIGAHPGLPDLAGFGRRTMSVTASEVYEMTVYQLGALQAFTRVEGGRLHHVKAHGALYHMLAEQRELAEVFARAIKDVQGDLIVYGPPLGLLKAAAEACGLRYAKEAFADRAYGRDGRLLPRSVAGAVLTDKEQMAKQVWTILNEGHVIAGPAAEQASICRLPLQADTICLHGDGNGAPKAAAYLRQALSLKGVRIQPL